MTQTWLRLASRALAATAVTGVLVVVHSASPRAQQPAREQVPESKAKEPAKAKPAKAAKANAEPAAGKADLVTAQRFVETGVTHLEAGRLDPAVTSLSSALAAGSLPAAQTARALYYRGSAYRRQGKPAQALSDLTSALSVRNGLTESQRAEALKERAAAYRDAGLPDQSEADSIRFAKSTAAEGAPLATAGTGNAGAGSAAASGGGFFGSWFGGGQSAPAAPARSGAAPPAPAATSDQSADARASWGKNVEVRAAAPAAPGQSKSKPEAKSSPAVRTAEVTRPAAAAKPGKGAAAEAAPTGSVRVQIALVRSRAEAEAIAGQVRQKHARALVGRQATIDEVVMGSMGTLYRLRVGPYADAAEPRSLCASLKSDGLHCVTSTQ